jgi:hypothetical protein
MKAAALKNKSKGSLSGGIELSKVSMQLSMALVLAAGAACAPAAQLSTDARGAIPHDVQQLVVIDYRAMQNSTAAMDLRNRVMPPELKQFDEALEKSGLNDNHDVDELAFALFRTKSDSDSLETVGIAQGQFDVPSIIAGFKKNKVKASVVRTNSIYPMTKAGMMLCFVDPSTMVFGEKEAVMKALDARDGIVPSMLSNNGVMSAMQSVDSNPLWSVLDEKGTQTMMSQLLGSAGSAGSGQDFQNVQKNLVSSWYSMDFQHGVKFDLTVATGDAFTASALSSLMTAAVMVRKMSSNDTEKQALNATSITASAGQLTIDYSSTDNQFSSLLQSPLFGNMVR